MMYGKHRDPEYLPIPCSPSLSPALPRVPQSGCSPHRWHPCASAAASSGPHLLCLLLLGRPVGPQGQVNSGLSVPPPPAQARGSGVGWDLVSAQGWGRAGLVTHLSPRYRGSWQRSRPGHTRSAACLPWKPSTGKFPSCRRVTSGHWAPGW